MSRAELITHFLVWILWGYAKELGSKIQYYNDLKVTYQRQGEPKYYA